MKNENDLDVIPEIRESSITIEEDKLIKSIGVLQTSTGALYLASILIYWLFLSSLVIFLVGLLEDGEFLFLVFIINGFTVYETFVSVLCLLIGAMLIKSETINEKLVRIAALLSIFLFPFGTISGIITLKEFGNL